MCVCFACFLALFSLKKIKQKKHSCKEEGGLNTMIYQFNSIHQCPLFVRSNLHGKKVAVGRWQRDSPASEAPWSRIFGWRSTTSKQSNQ